jgi:hypothetical protein
LISAMFLGVIAVVASVLGGHAAENTGVVFGALAAILCLLGVLRLRTAMRK